MEELFEIVRLVRSLKESNIQFVFTLKQVAHFSATMYLCVSFMSILFSVTENGEQGASAIFVIAKPFTS